MTNIAYDSFDERLNVSPEELEKLVGYFLSAGCPRCRAQKGEVLELQGDDAKWLFLILSGQTKVTICDAQGQEKTISVQEAVYGNVVLVGESGFFAQRTYNGSLIAKTDIEYIRIGKMQLEEVISAYPELAWKIMNSMGKKIYHLVCEVAELSFYDTYTRLIEKLLSLAKESGEINDCGEVIIRVRLTDEELAALLATSREVITRHMGKLQKLGVLRRENRQIVLSNTTALRAAVAKAKTGLDPDDM